MDYDCTVPGMVSYQSVLEMNISLMIENWYESRRIEEIAGSSGNRRDRGGAMDLDAWVVRILVVHDKVHYID